MNINIEVKPREWYYILLCMVIAYLLFKGNVGEVINIVKGWLINQ